MKYYNENKKSIKLTALALILSLSVTGFAGCSKANKDQVSPKPSHEAVAGDNGYKSDDNMASGDNQMLMEPYDNLDEYVEMFGTKLSQKDYDKLSPIYNEMVKRYKDGKLDQNQLQDEMLKFDQRLRIYGVPLPYYGLSDFITTVDNMSEADRKFIIENEDKILPMENSDPDISEDEAEKLYDKAKEVFASYGLSFDDIVEQIMNQNQIFATFNIDGSDAKLNLDRKANARNLSSKTLNTYRSIIEKTYNIIPKDVWGVITEFEFNTDGVENVLAHTVPIDGSNKTFRMALDVTDMFDKAGKLTKLGEETIVHEAAHVITLNAPQIKSENIEDPTITDVSKLYKKDSYLLQFYNKFWQDKYDDFLKIKDETGSTEDFYQKYKSEFDNDYAASALEEDIAESFRLFVYKDKPQGNSIVEQKIKFFYEFDELVKLRDQFRNNLSLN